MFFPVSTHESIFHMKAFVLLELCQMKTFKILASDATDLLWYIPPTYYYD